MTEPIRKQIPRARADHGAHGARREKSQKAACARADHRMPGGFCLFGKHAARHVREKIARRVPACNQLVDVVLRSSPRVETGIGKGEALGASAEKS